jgi:cytochrome b
MNDFGEGANASGATPLATAAEHMPEETIRVWDPLVRIFHWSLVTAFAIAWATGDEMRDFHEIAGYTIMGLLVVRVAWGVIGSQHARFSDFIYRPSSVIAYLFAAIRFRAKRYLGHNPAGGAMVLALMVTLLTACVSGFLMTTDAYWGVGWMRDLHEMAVNTAIVLAGLHLAGVFFASVEHRENLVGAMVTGRKRR